MEKSTAINLMIPYPSVQRLKEETRQNR
jgi:hypothetical protein